MAQQLVLLWQQPMEGSQTEQRLLNMLPDCVAVVAGARVSAWLLHALQPALLCWRSVQQLVCCHTLTTTTNHTRDMCGGAGASAGAGTDG